MQVNPLLVISFAVAALVDLGAPLALALFLARRCHGRWRYWLYGVLVFLLSQGFTRIPAMVFLQTRPSVHVALQEPAWFWPFLLFAAFTAGLFEEGGRWLAFRFLVPPAERHWRTSLMLGAGHGGLESVGVGGWRSPAWPGIWPSRSCPWKRSAAPPRRSRRPGSSSPPCAAGSPCWGRGSGWGRWRSRSR